MLSFILDSYLALLRHAISLLAKGVQVPDDSGVQAGPDCRLLGGFQAVVAAQASGHVKGLCDPPGPSVLL